MPREMMLTVALANLPLRECLEKRINRLTTQRCCSSAYEPERTEIVLCAFFSGAQHLHQDWWDNADLLNVEPLYRIEERL